MPSKSKAKRKPVSREALFPDLQGSLVRFSAPPKARRRPLTTVQAAIQKMKAKETAQ